VNILVFSQHFWPESFRINELSQDLSDEGENVSVLTGKPNYPGGTVFPGYQAFGMQKDTFDGMTVHRVPLVPRGRGGALRMFANYMSFIFSASFFGPILLRKQKIDVVFVYATSPLIQGLAALPLKLFFGAKLVVWVQDLWPEDLASTGYITNSFLLKINEWPAKLLYNFTDRILIQSESFRTPVSRLVQNKNKEIHVLPNPAERAVFQQSEQFALPEELEFMKEGFNVVFAGNIGNNQSVETIVEAATKLKSLVDLRIVMVGSGSRSEYLKEEVTKRGLENLKVVGRYPLEFMPAIYEQSDALLVSLASKENLSWTVPCKVQTYMAAGKPIVASINGEGAKIVLESGAGVVSQAEDANGLAHCIIELHAMSDMQRKVMGMKGRAYAEAYYHPTKIAKQLVSHFQSVLES
jgi:glycosyltransferase involved in cell wall biosynthesis